MNTNTTRKVKIVINGYADTIISAVHNFPAANSGASTIRIIHVEVPLTEIKFILVGYNQYHPNKSTLIGASTTTIYFPYSVNITCLNKKLLPHRGDNSLIFISHIREFSMDDNDSAKYFTRNKYFHARDIPQKTWQERTFTGFCTAYAFLSFWPFNEYLYLV